MSKRTRWVFFVLVALFWGQACDDSDDGGELSGCGSDNDCKGDRICVNKTCVDPESADDTSGTGGTDSSPLGGTDYDTGTVADTSTGDTEPADEVSDAELEEACMSDCDAQQLPDCSETIPTADQCQASCLLLDSTLQGYCFREQRDFYLCKAEAGYTCIDNRAIAHSSCLEEQTAIYECRQEIVCHKYCKKALDESCITDESSCFDTCILDRKEMDSSCSSYYESLLSCWSNSMVCVEGSQTASECEDSVARVAWCLGVHVNDCEGYCWAAEQLGCGSEDCATSCQVSLDDSQCGYKFRDYLGCILQLSELNMTCSDGAPIPTESCATKHGEYLTCQSGAR